MRSLHPSIDRFVWNSDLRYTLHTYTLSHTLVYTCLRRILFRWKAGGPVAAMTSTRTEQNTRQYETKHSILFSALVEQNKIQPFHVRLLRGTCLLSSCCAFIERLARMVVAAVRRNGRRRASEGVAQPATLQRNKIRPPTIDLWPHGVCCDSAFTIT